MYISNIFLVFVFLHRYSNYCSFNSTHSVLFEFQQIAHYYAWKLCDIQINDVRDKTSTQSGQKRSESNITTWGRYTNAAKEAGLKLSQQKHFHSNLCKRQRETVSKMRHQWHKSYHNKRFERVTKTNIYSHWIPDKANSGLIIVNFLLIHDKKTPFNCCKCFLCISNEKETVKSNI